MTSRSRGRGITVEKKQCKEYAAYGNSIGLCDIYIDLLMMLK